MGKECDRQCQVADRPGPGNICVRFTISGGGGGGCGSGGIGGGGGFGFGFGLGFGFGGW